MSNKPMFIKPHELVISFIPERDGRYSFELTGAYFSDSGKANKHHSLFAYDSVAEAQAVAESIVAGAEIGGKAVVIL